MNRLVLSLSLFLVACGNTPSVEGSMTLVDSLGISETMRVDPRAPLEGGAVFGTCVVTDDSGFLSATVRLEQPGAPFDFLEIARVDGDGFVRASLNGTSYGGSCRGGSINDSGRFAPSFTDCELIVGGGRSVSLSGTFEFLDCDDDF